MGAKPMFIMETLEKKIAADIDGQAVENGTLYVGEYRGMGNIYWTSRPEEEVLMDFFETSSDEVISQKGGIIHESTGKVARKARAPIYHRPGDHHWEEEMVIFREEGESALRAFLVHEDLAEDKKDLEVIVQEIKTLHKGGVITGTSSVEHLFVAPMTKREFLECTTGEGQVRKEDGEESIFHTIGGDRSIAIPEHLQEPWEVFKSYIK